MLKLKHVNGAFINLMNDQNSCSEPEKFIINSPSIESRQLKTLTMMYNNNVESVIDRISYLAKLEELILQLRALENLKEIKLSIVRDRYIYARSPFLKIGSSTKDHRIIVGKTEYLGNDLNQLSQDRNFMDYVKLKMEKSMKTLIIKTAQKIPSLKELSTNLFKHENINNFNLN
jgi:hypothetical protein